MPTFNANSIIESDSEEDLFATINKKPLANPTTPTYLTSPKKSRENLDATRIVRLTFTDDPIDLHHQEISTHAWNAGYRKATEMAEFRASSWSSPTRTLTLKEKIEKDSEEARKALAKLKLERTNDEEKLKIEFQGKNEAMKKRIEQVIRQKREEHERKEKLKQEALEKVKKEQEEKLRKEKELKEAEERHIKEELELKQKQEADKVAKENAAKEAELNKLAQEEQAKKLQEAKFASPKAVEMADKYRNMLQEINQQLKPKIQGNKEVKNYCFTAKRSIRPKMGQLVNTPEDVTRITNELNNIFIDAKQKSPEVYRWIMNLAAKSVIDQAETEVTVKQSTAYPLARVCVNLINTHPEFLDLLLVRLIKHCPYVIPQYIGKKASQSKEDYLKLIGFKKKDGDEWETEVQYNERMGGILSLYSAIVQTSPENFQNPYGIANGWTWLARIVNLPPRPITPILINIFLEVAGPVFLQVYQGQAHKLLQLIIQSYLPLLSKESVAANTRLTSFLERYVQNGRTITGCEGRDYS
ncbi:GLE1-domain-containing protein [Basidiobolus meristosporus CBS 931.73]|uniref:mRNA export factor GLE1 n=1 Tax=Basidiobolus meristosporus CBS 931.73 TaxID=1314790 RepID=A0A1Y1YIT0_9FUNG|nr:GLE1-domain-containing protein [Basidiobolus meristosporus CBS 931.73]|eukprot:ORX97920.1 GLE1-domain-containing protein [Basidiobolus meristosporus CBS 931.73]